MRRYLTVFLAFFLLLTMISCGGGGDKSKAPKTRFISIGTGGITGVYYPAGGVIAKMINDKSDEYGLKATVQATGGSVFNINAITSGDMDFGIAQVDRLHQAYIGQAEWEGNPQTGLRTVFNLHTESVTLIASETSGIQKAEDLRGKTVAIGNPGSGNRGNAIDALSAYNMTLDDIRAEDLKPAECAGMLQDGRIDAYFYTVGHPNGSIKEAVAGQTKVRFIALDKVDSLITKYPYYSKSIIDISSYPGVLNTENVESFGVKATIVTSEKEPDDIVYTLAKEVFENFENFKTQHPAFINLTKEGMITGLTAPLHPGAKKYFVEKGLLSE